MLSWIHFKLYTFYSFQWLENKHFQPGLFLGKYNFKDDKIDSIVQSFYAKLESVLQSSKFESLMLNDPFDLHIKVLGAQHMKELRQKQGNILKNLNFPNYGLTNLFGISDKQGRFSKMKEKRYCFEVPTTFAPHQTEMENYFKSNCLIMSIIMGM